MKVYTRTGDKGTTSLSDGSRVNKSDTLLHAYGTVDELNSQVGLLISEYKDDFLTEIQNELFIVGGMLATPLHNWEKYWNISQLSDFTKIIETNIDALTAQTEPLKGFILPQGSRTIAMAHICRTVCRRAERFVCELMKNNDAFSPIQILLNRLSDYFFILALFFHKKENVNVIYYKSTK